MAFECASGARDWSTLEETESGGSALQQYQVDVGENTYISITVPMLDNCSVEIRKDVPTASSIPTENANTSLPDMSLGTGRQTNRFVVNGDQAMEEIRTNEEKIQTVRKMIQSTVDAEITAFDNAAVRDCGFGRTGEYLWLDRTSPEPSSSSSDLVFSSISLFCFPSCRSLVLQEQAIAEKGFYLHRSPLSTPRGSEPPELLPLFPLSSPKQQSGDP
ncbi:hypothetical protein HHK36_007885 [Tetracentron sinense]|uniref:Uncharacterized protein n=1 Tax=Tetracentron sinense TaxID=13715 RepID=A0A835DJE1_TETSI|nr:hypothetical protein HHK36_007885 [Tetracentron sinense]